MLRIKKEHHRKKSFQEECDLIVEEFRDLAKAFNVDCGSSS